MVHDSSLTRCIRLWSCQSWLPPAFRPASASPCSCSGMT